MFDDDRKKPELIPVTGKTEVKSVSALLAVLTRAPSFADPLLRRVGAPPALIDRLHNKRQPAEVKAITQPHFPKAVGRDQPDGLLEVSHASGEWRMLIEAKVNGGRLGEQVDRYWKQAREARPAIDALLLISNDLRFDDRPRNYGRGRAPRVKIEHLSWAEILAMAQLAMHTPDAEDTLEGWLTGELIRYLNNAKSGVVQPDSMGKFWNRVLRGAPTGTLEPEHVEDVVDRIDQVFLYTSLKLGSEIGKEVTYRQRSNDDLRDLTQQVIAGEAVSGRLELPDRRVVNVGVDLARERLWFSMRLEAPNGSWSKPKTVKWLIGQLKSAPDRLEIRTYERRRGPQAAMCSLRLKKARIDYQPLLLPTRKSLDRFELLYEKPLNPRKETNGKAVGFVQALVRDTIKFHDQVVGPTTV